MRHWHWSENNRVPEPSPLVTELSRTHNLLIMSRCKPGLFMVRGGTRALCCSRIRKNSGVTRVHGLTSCEASYGTMNNPGKRKEEREFYLRPCIQEGWGKRELQRQLNGALFERTVLSPAKLATVVRELHLQAATVFRPLYRLQG